MIAITDKTQLAKGQQTIFDLDIWSGKMFPEHLVQTKEKILESSSKKPRKWSRGMPAFLDLRGGQSGQPQEQSWEMGGLLLGEYTMHSFGESPSEEKGSRLSQILEEQPHPKYCLSAKACQGILNRAERRGKVLPEILKMALLRQSHSLNEQDARGGVKEYSSKTSESQPSQPSTINPCALEQTVATDVESRAWDGSQVSHTLTANNADGSQRMPDKDNFNAVITYGIDRAAFNQGKNALYDFSVIEDQAQTIVARGPGGVLAKQ